MESEFHPAQGLADEGFLSMLRVLGDENIKLVRGELVTFPLFIPTIPQFLDACVNCMPSYTFVNVRSGRIPLTDMDDLSEFLALDCFHQQDKLLAKVIMAGSWQHILPNGSGVWREGIRRWRDGRKVLLIQSPGWDHHW